MEKQQIIGLAKQGDLEAIAILLNQSLARYDTIAKVGQSTECLFVTLISDPVPDEATVIPIVLQEIERWKTDNIKKIKIYGRTERQVVPAWEDEMNLEKLPQMIPTRISQEPPTILNKPPLETNNLESNSLETNSTELASQETDNSEVSTAVKPAFNLRNLPMWGKGAIVALFASVSAGSLALVSNQLNTKTPTQTTTPIPISTPSASPTPTSTPTSKPTTEPPKATTTPTPTPTASPKATTSETKKTTTTPAKKRRTTTNTQQTQTQPTQSTKRRKTTTNNRSTETKKTGTSTNNNNRSTQRTTTPKKTTPKPTQRTTPQVKPTVAPTPQSTSRPLYVPPPENKTVETVPKAVDTPVRTNTNNRRNTDITPPSTPANRRNTDVTPPSAPASKKDDAPTGNNGGDTP